MGYSEADIARFGPGARQQILRQMSMFEDRTAPSSVEAGKQELHFTIYLDPVTKKNSQRVIPCGRYHKVLPSKAYERYEKDARSYITCREWGIDGPIDRPCEVVGLFYMKTRRKVDLTNLLEALDDVLVRHGVLADDNSQIVVSHDGSRVFHDPRDPRTEVTIRYL